MIEHLPRGLTIQMYLISPIECHPFGALQKVSLGEAPQRITHHETGRVFGVITSSYRVVEDR